MCSASAPTPPPLLRPGGRSTDGLFGRQQAKLGEHAEEIDCRPRLGDLAVLNAEDVDLLNRNPLSGGW